jgi:hypothetical protein
MKAKQAYERIADVDVHATFSGVPLHFVRRRYSNCTFTWLWWWNGVEWIEEGTPWQSIVIPKRDLEKMFGNPAIVSQPLAV